MLIPINTDAPVYHFPFATLGLMAVNVAAFVATGGGNGELTETLMLAFADGLHPLQWLTMNFVHFGLLHLIGNMIFLWGFGLVVEGKLGWWRYLLVYLGIGMLGGLVIQLAMFGYDGFSQGAGGASLVIYGLLAMSLVWAPKNEVSCLLILFFRVFTFEITILTFALIYIGMEIAFAGMQGFSISSEMLHLTGAVLGFAVGALLLRYGLADCEGWDLWSVMKGTPGHRDLDSYRYGSRTAWGRGKRSRKNGAAKVSADDDADPDASAAVVRTKAEKRIRQTLTDGNTAAALREYRRLKHLQPHWQAEPADLLAQANALYKMKAWSDAVPLLEACLDRCPDQSSRIRLKLAAVALEIQNRPRHALRLIEPVSPESLEGALREQRMRIERKARQLIDEGVIEMEGQAWT